MGSSEREASQGSINDKVVPAPSRSALPEYILRRNALFDQLKLEYDAEVANKVHKEINVAARLGDVHKMLPAKAWESTPGTLLRHLEDVPKDIVVAKVNDKDFWDLDRPLEYDCQVSYVRFSDSEGKKVFWHSSAHVLGEAAECHYNCLLSHGPPVEQGFFYDMALEEG